MEKQDHADGEFDSLEWGEMVQSSHGADASVSLVTRGGDVTQLGLQGHFFLLGENLRSSSEESKEEDESEDLQECKKRKLSMLGEISIEKVAVHGKEGTEEEQQRAEGTVSSLLSQTSIVRYMVRNLEGVAPQIPKFEVRAADELEEDSIGSGLWLSSICFGIIAHHFLDLFANKRVVELGAGVGLGCNILQQLQNGGWKNGPAHVVATDYTPALVKTLGENIAMNTGSADVKDIYHTALFDWYKVEQTMEESEWGDVSTALCGPDGFFDELPSDGDAASSVFDTTPKQPSAQPKEVQVKNMFPFLTSHWDTVIGFDCVYKALSAPLQAALKFLVMHVKVNDILLISPHTRDGLDDVHYFLQSLEEGEVLVGEEVFMCKRAVTGDVDVELRYFRASLRVIHWRRC